MKLAIVFIALCLVAYSTQTSLYVGCEDNVKEFMNVMQCIKVECVFFRNETANISNMSAHSCPSPRCEEGKQLKDTIPGDENAVYPGCCATPVCE